MRTTSNVFVSLSPLQVTCMAMNRVHQAKPRLPSRPGMGRGCSEELTLTGVGDGQSNAIFCEEVYCKLEWAVIAPVEPPPGVVLPEGHAELKDGGRIVVNDSVAVSGLGRTGGVDMAAVEAELDVEVFGVTKPVLEATVVAGGRVGWKTGLVEAMNILVSVVADAGVVVATSKVSAGAQLSPIIEAYSAATGRGKRLRSSCSHKTVTWSCCMERTPGRVVYMSAVVMFGMTRRASGVVTAEVQK